MWRKWVQLATLGVINCLLRGNIGQAVGVSGGSELNLLILGECADIATQSISDDLFNVS
jgi:hypothetical protein